MPFDVFRLREHVVREYRDYVESFVHVLDPRIDQFVRERLAEGELWPEAVLQLTGLRARNDARRTRGQRRHYREHRPVLRTGSAAAPPSGGGAGGGGPWRQL